MHSAVHPDIRQAALEWLVTLWSGEVSAQEKQAWQQWHDAHPDHQAAWAEVQQLEKRLQGLPGAIAGQTLRASSQTDINRRRLLKGLGALAALGVGVQGVRRSDTWLLHTADIHTAVGEIRTLTLDDGTRISLNTTSAIDVRFTAQERRLILRRGSILVDTAHEARPFFVETQEGTAQALGTRFTVGQGDARSCVAVYEGRVRIEPAERPDQALVLNAGQRSNFSSTQHAAVEAADEINTAWARGRLIAENMRLADFLAVLGRYRHGVIRCDAAVADLKVSGVFPLDDTDRVLLSLSQALPVQLAWSTRLWVTVEPRAEKNPSAL